jgi:uroporphyrinogen decarboxylase
MNKVERVEAIFRNEKADVVPAGFWFHYKSEWNTLEMADAHIKTFRETGMDIMKVMQDYTFKLDTPVQVPGDWKKVKFPGISSPVFQKLLDVLKRILDKLGGEAMVFQTMYGPFKSAVISYGDALLMAHSKEAPEAVAAAVDGIAESLAEWAAAFVEAGAAGLYYAAQFSEPGRFAKEVWEKLVKPADLAVLQAAEKKGGRNILHICGEPEYKFETSPRWFADYPAAIVNWSVKDNGLSLSAGREIFKKPILGGLNNKGNILNGSDADIAAEVQKVIREFGTSGLMIGADCTIQGQGISHGKIKAAVDAAHNFH